MTPADAILCGFIGGGLFVVALLVALLVVAKVTNQRADDDWSQFIDGMVSAGMTDTRTNGPAPDERAGDGGGETQVHQADDGYYRVDPGPDWPYEVRLKSGRGVILADFYES